MAAKSPANSRIETEGQLLVFYAESRKELQKKAMKESFAGEPAVKRVGNLEKMRRKSYRMNDGFDKIDRLEKSTGAHHDKYCGNRYPVG